jgi:hypothetical protein
MRVVAGHKVRWVSAVRVKLTPKSSRAGFAWWPLHLLREPGYRIAAARGCCINVSYAGASGRSSGENCAR